MTGTLLMFMAEDEAGSSSSGYGDTEHWHSYLTRGSWVSSCSCSWGSRLVCWQTHQVSGCCMVDSPGHQVSLIAAGWHTGLGLHRYRNGWHTTAHTRSLSWVLPWLNGWQLHKHIYYHMADLLGGQGRRWKVRKPQTRISNVLRSERYDDENMVP